MFPVPAMPSRAYLDPFPAPFFNCLLQILGSQKQNPFSFLFSGHQNKNHSAQT